MRECEAIFSSGREGGADALTHTQRTHSDAYERCDGVCVLPEAAAWDVHTHTYRYKTYRKELKPEQWLV